MTFVVVVVVVVVVVAQTSIECRL